MRGLFLFFDRVCFAHPKPGADSGIWSDKEFVDEDRPQNPREEGQQNSQIVLANIGNEFVINHFLDWHMENKNAQGQAADIFE